MDPNQRLDLAKLMKEYNSEDTTDKIRELKHSKLISDDIMTFQRLQHEYSRLKHTNKEQFRAIAEKRCVFLYNNYTNIFNRLYKNELDLNIMSKFLSVLSQIEDGKIDQHDGSYMIGTILKEMYIDSALKQDKKVKDKAPIYKKEAKKINWNDYKNMNIE